MQTLAARLADTASTGPSRIAVAQQGRRLDYRGLQSAAGRFAHALHAAGVSPGDRVALILPNGIDAVVAWYGTWRAGAVVVPLNAQARMRDFLPWLRHCGARLLVHAPGHDEAAQAAGEACIDAWAGLGDMLAAGEGEGGGSAMPGIDALAAILYTSGTTGDPKGVALSHRNLAANTSSILAYLQLGPGDSTVSALPFYYAYGASVLHTHLAAGARVVLENNVVFPHLVVEALARERATGFSGVPSTFALLLDRGEIGRHDLSSLRYLTQAGGAMSPALATRVRDAFPQSRLFVMYGQTEASARLTCLPPERLGDKLGSVGTPISGVEIEVRREDGARAATGEDGEVWARGDNVMTGYWHASEATAAVLVEGWLHTGDVGRLDDDGFLWLSGRRSDMIKTGAHRVHPQDVEEAIAELPGVREVAVAGADDPLLGQVVVAHVVRTGESPDDMAVKAHCRRRLAGYKIPKRVMFVDELPRTASGKIRRVALKGECR